MPRASRSSGKRSAARKRGAALTRKLPEYEAKRDFAVTPEPAPGKAEPHPEPSFVVHKHDASRLHYDVRLEMDGALASWSVPKGPSYDPSVKRLAIQTEDHPLEYGSFEGRIPDGEYGAGDSLIWDRGTVESVPPGQLSQQRKKGHVVADFHGSKLKGQWHLVRTHGGAPGKAQWLMFKDYPFGCGHRCTAVLSPRYLDDSQLTGAAGQDRVRSSHNTFMSLVVEHGIFGAMFYFVYLLWVLSSLRKFSKAFRNSEGFMATLLPAIAAVAVAMTLGDMFVDYLTFEMRIWIMAILMVLVSMATKSLQLAVEERTRSGNFGPRIVPALSSDRLRAGN